MQPRASKLVTVAAGITGLVTLAGVLGACSTDDGASDQTIAPLITTTTALVTTTAAPPSTVAPTLVTSTTAPSSTTTTTPASTTTSTTTTTPPASARLVLQPDGVGDALFGADPAQVISYVTSILGEPTSDSEWVNATSDFPDCPGDELRVVRWRDLRLLFSDSSPSADGRRHFFAYQLGPALRADIAPAGMRTESQLGVDSSVGEVRFTFPDVVLWDDELRGPSFLLPDGVNGTVEGLADDALVTMIMSGPRCDG